MSYAVLFSRCDCGTSALHVDTPLGVMRSKYQVFRPENVILWDSFNVPDWCCHVIWNRAHVYVLDVRLWYHLDQTEAELSRQSFSPRPSNLIQ